MELEFRLRNFRNFDWISKIDTDIIGVGDEGCVYKVPYGEKLLEIRKNIEINNKKFRYVIPKVTDTHFDEVIKSIKLLTEENDDYYLTVNDYGVMYECKKLKILPRNITIGRTLSRSFEDCLWYEHILRNENEFNKMSILQNNMAHGIKLAFFRQYNVTAIESNMLKHQNTAFNNIRNHKFKVAVHAGSVSVAFSRVCQTLRYCNNLNGTDISPSYECASLCNDRIYIDMDTIWHRNQNGNFSDQQLSAELKNLNPNFFLIGNVLMRNKRFLLSDYHLINCDSLILNDYIFGSNVFKINEIVKKIRKAGEALR